MCVHCLGRVTATGTLVMCLRKLQRWALPPIVAEYTRFDRRLGLGLGFGLGLG